MKNKFTKRAILTAMACMVPAMAMAAPALNSPEKAISEVMPKAKMSLHNEFTGTQSDAKLGKFTLAEIEINLDPSMAEKINVEDILPMTTPYVEKEITINELNELMAKISMYCRSKGFAAATCYLPEQKAKYAIIHLDVIPGTYGQIKFENNSGISDAALAKYANKLKAGKVITTRDLESVLRNISNIGGVGQATGVLSPGAEIGSSDVTIRVNDGQKTSTLVYADNYGSVNTGRYRYGFQTNINQITPDGMSAKIGGMLSNTSHNQKNYYASVETPVGNGDTVLGVGISRMNYEGGGQLAALGTQGTAQTLSMYGKTSFMNATDSSLSVNYGVDYKTMKDELSGYGMKSEGHSTSAHIGIDGMFRGEGSVFQYDLTGYYGNVTKSSSTFDDSTPGSDPYYTNRTGNYTKGVLNTKYIQSLGHKTDVVLKGQVQMASTRLHGSEKFVLGGPNGIRAYAQNAVSGDQGGLASLEFRYHNGHGLTYSTYFDCGTVNSSRDYSEGSKTLMGYGFGLSYFKANDWFGRFDYARRISDYDVNGKSANSDKGRLWFTLGKLF